MEKERATKIIQFRPAVNTEQGELKYTDEDLKGLLFSFARDIERVRSLSHWRADKLRRFISTAFDSQ